MNASVESHVQLVGFLFPVAGILVFLVVAVWLAGLGLCRGLWLGLLLRGLGWLGLKRGVGARPGRAAVVWLIIARARGGPCFRLGPLARKASTPKALRKVECGHISAFFDLLQKKLKHRSEICMLPVERRPHVPTC